MKYSYIDFLAVYSSKCIVRYLFGEVEDVTTSDVARQVIHRCRIMKLHRLHLLFDRVVIGHHECSQDIWLAGRGGAFKPALEKWTAPGFWIAWVRWSSRAGNYCHPV